LDNPELDAALARIAELEQRLVRIEAQLLPGQTPTPGTQEQGYLAGRWNRRDPQYTGGGLAEVPEAPSDLNTYGRFQQTWQPVVEEAPATVSGRRLAYNAYARHGTDKWVHMDVVLADYVEDVPIANGVYARARNPDGTGWTEVSGSAGIPDVPEGSGAYARTRLSGNPATWTNLNEMRIASLDSPAFQGSPTVTPTPPTGANSALLANTEFVARDFLPKTGGQLSGPLIAVQGGGLTNLGLAVGDNATGWYRSGNVLVMSVSGAFVQQWLVDMVQMAVPIMMGGTNKITNLGDATAPQDALNLRTADARYAAIGSGGGNFLPISGGTLTGELVTQPGTGIRDLGIGIGDNSTGFYRNGAALVTMALGFPLMTVDGDSRSVAIIGPLTMAGSPIHNVANPTAPTDALNQQSGDARYPTLAGGGIITGPLQLYQTPFVPNDVTTKNYVDVAILNARSPTVLYDLPADVAFPGDGAWHLLAQVPFVLTRTGISRIQVTLNANVRGVNNVAALVARLAEGGAERSIFGFGISPGGESVGFVCNLYYDSAAGAMTIPIEMTSTSLGSPPQPFTILGGSGPARSQIVIVDLGPV
jgi:hypothetical protein